MKSERIASQKEPEPSVAPGVVRRICLNCGAQVEHSFCPACGQKYRDNGDRSIKRLFGELITNIFFFDSRLWVSLRYLFFKPGVMSREYLDGKRKKFLSPISIFLFANLLYFFATPITDYSLPLQDQMQHQVHSPLARELVKERLADRDLTLEDYSQSYDRASLNLSKSIMIVNVPLLALMLWPLLLRRSRYYYDALIFSLHYFSVFLFVLVGFNGIFRMILKLGIPLNEVSMLLLAVFGFPLVMGVISIRNYLQSTWWYAILGGVVVILGLGFAQFVYRAVIFFGTFVTT
ncbi:MAG: DUF3667 domain-containing protein [Bacteroidota bacterium]